MGETGVAGRNYGLLLQFTGNLSLAASGIAGACEKVTSDLW